jgi:hypothetical protein
MTRQKAYTTAAARRRANPIELIIDDRTIRLKPSADLADIADLIDELGRPLEDGESEIRSAINRKSHMIDLVRTFVEKSSHEEFDQVSPDLDPMILQQILVDLIVEYTGQANPTQAPSSSDGSPETGNSLTDGAQPEE